MKTQTFRDILFAVLIIINLALLINAKTVALDITGNEKSIERIHEWMEEQEHSSLAQELAIQKVADDQDLIFHRLKGRKSKF